MKKQIKGYIVYRTEDWYDEHERFQFTRFDPRQDGSSQQGVFVREHEMEVEVPDDFDPRPLQLAALEAQKTELRAKFSAAVKELDDRIRSLMALEMA